MKNATLSARLVLLLGGALILSFGHATKTSAQTDDTTNDAADAGDDSAATEGGDDAADATDGATSDEAAEPAEGAEPVEAAEAPVEEPEATEPEVTEPATTQLAEPESELEEGDLDEPGEGEAEAEAEAEAPAGPEPLPWRSTFFSWTHQATFNSFLRDAQLTYNPTYQQNFSLSPRWYVAPMTFFWANVSLGLEVTDTDFNALNRDPQFGDTQIELRHMIPWEGFIFILQGRVGIPTSKASLATQRYLQLGLGTTVVRIIPEINTTLAGIFAYRRWFAGSNVVQVGEPQPDSCPAAPPPVSGGGASAPEINDATCDQLGTPSAGVDTILAGISTTTTFDNFSFSLSAFMFTLYGYELAPAYINVATSEEPLVIQDGSPSHWRNFTYFSLSIAYQFTPWLNMTLGIQNSGNVASLYAPDGSLYNPLFTPDTQVFLTATIGMDELYNELFTTQEEGLTPEELQRRRQGLASGPTTGGAF